MLLHRKLDQNNQLNLLSNLLNLFKLSVNISFQGIIQTNFHSAKCYWAP